MEILSHGSTRSGSFPFSCRGRSNSSRKGATDSPASSRRRIPISCKNANTARRIAHILAARCFLHCPDIPEDRFHVMAQAGCMIVPCRPELGDDVVSSWRFPRCPQDPPPSTRWACISLAVHILPADMPVQSGTAWQHWRCAGNSRLPENRHRYTPHETEWEFCLLLSCRCLAQIAVLPSCSTWC